MRFNFTRLSLLKFFVLNKKRTRRTLLVINFSIFLTIFAATSAIISLYTENKISEKEFELIEIQRTQNYLHNFKSALPMLHASVDSTIIIDRLINRFFLLIDGTKFYDKLINKRELYFYRAHALIGPMYDMFEEEIDEMLEEMKQILPEIYDDEYMDSLTQNGELFKKYNTFKKKYKHFKENTKEFEQYEALTKYELLKESKSEEYIDSYIKYEDYYDLGYDLNLWFINFVELLDIMYLDLEHWGKSDMAILNREIINLSKNESLLILFAFFLQLIIFCIIQFFEISAVVIESYTKRRKK